MEIPISQDNSSTTKLLCIHWHSLTMFSIASFPGPTQLFVLIATESWAGPGNEAMFSTDKVSWMECCWDDPGIGIAYVQYHHDDLEGITLIL